MYQFDSSEYLLEEDKNDGSLYGGFSGFENATVNTKKQRTILPDLVPYDLPEEIKNQADAIYNKMTPRVHRNKIRIQLLFYCVYCAYLELRIDVNPMSLGEVFGLTQGEVQKCYSIFSPLKTDYSPPCNNISPISYFPDFCSRFGLSDEARNDLVKLANNILKKEPALYQDHPQTVAAGIFRYYTLLNGITSEDNSLLVKVTKRSLATIDVVCKKIQLIDNK